MTMNRFILIILFLSLSLSFSSNIAYPEVVVENSMFGTGGAVSSGSGGTITAGELIYQGIVIGETEISARSMAAGGSYGGDYYMDLGLYGVFTGEVKKSTLWYFAEGCTSWTFDEWILIQNPNDTTAYLRVSFMGNEGVLEELDISIPADSRYTIYVDDVVSNDSVSTMIESLNDLGVIAERSMYWNVDDLVWIGGHCTRGVTEPSTTWYFAEGCTAGSFDEWILVQNPSERTAEINLKIMSNEGILSEVNYGIPSLSRLSIRVNDIVPNESVSAKIESSNGVGVIAERSMYWNVDDLSWMGGHCSRGVTEPSTTWYFAEGCTAGTFDEWILIQNPCSRSADVTISFMTGAGIVEEQYIVIPSNTRHTIYVNDIVPSESVSVKVESTNGVGLVAERAMYWDVEELDWMGGHCSKGVTDPSTTWYFAEGCTTGTFDEWILIQNPNEGFAALKVTIMSSEGDIVETNITVSAESRYSLHVNDIFPDGSVSVEVEATNGISVIAERAMYWDVDAQSNDSLNINSNEITWAGGHSSTGI